MAKTKVEQANRIVRNYMFGAVGMGFVPIPLVVDLVALSALQLKMLDSLANLYHVEFSKNRGKSLIAALLGGGVPVSFSSNLTHFLKGVPLIDKISMSVLGGASTYAIGKVFIQHFESGGTFLTFEPKKVADYYAQQLEIGSEKNWIGQKP